MSHIKNITTANYGEVTIYHNGDWSGKVKIIWVERPKGQPAVVKSVELPGIILTKLGYIAAVDVVKNKIVSALEDI